MTIVAIRQKLVNYMKVADDKKVKAMYALFEDEIKQSEHISIEEYNNELEEAEAEFNKGEYITHEAMLNQVKQW